MKRQLSIISGQKTKKRKIEESQPLPFIPYDLEDKILIDHFPDVAKISSVLEACNYIHTLSFVNKKWNRYVNDPQNIRVIINTINSNTINNTLCAAFTNQYSIAKAISIAGTKNYIAQNSLLYHKIKDDHPALPFSIPELVSKGADVNFGHFDGYFLYLASTRNYTYTKQLLDLGANPNSTDYGETPLELAIRNQDVDLIKLLLQYNPENKGLLAAIQKGNPTIIKCLLKHAHFTQEELDRGYSYAFRINANDNPAAQVLIVYYFSNVS